mgnify:CR=1 FL=1
MAKILWFTGEDVLNLTKNWKVAPKKLSNTGQVFSKTTTTQIPIRKFEEQTA